MAYGTRQPNPCVANSQGIPPHKDFELQLVDSDGLDDFLWLRVYTSNDQHSLSAAGIIKMVRATDTTIRLFNFITKGQPYLQLVGTKSDLSKAYLCTRIDFENDVAVQIVAVDNSGAGALPDTGGGSGSLAEVAGTVSFEGAPAERTVLIIADDQVNGRKVLAEAISNPDGSFSIQYPDWEGSVIALALDHYGDDWQAETALNAGTIVHPTVSNGFVYEASEAGTTGITEPAWSTDGTTAVNDGSVTWNPKPYYRPTASGPIRGNVTQSGAPTIPTHRYVRLWIDSHNGGPYFSIQELEIASEVGGADLTAPSMTTDQGSFYTGYPASKAIDDLDDGGNVWLASSTISNFPNWMTIDLGVAVPLKELRIKPQDGNVDRSPKSFTFEVSDDGLNWSAIKTFTDVTDWVSGEAKVFSLFDGETVLPV